MNKDQLIKHDKILTNLACLYNFYGEKELKKELKKHKNITIIDVNRRLDYLFLAQLEDYLSEEEIQESIRYCKEIGIDLDLTDEELKQAWKANGLQGLVDLTNKRLDDI